MCHQALFLAIHELAHNLFFKKPAHNRYFAMVANWPIGIPYCVPFRGYHLEHHKWQGVDGIDTDIPSELEGRLIRGPVTKTIWACCQILTYALRPMFIKAQDVTTAHVMNWASQIAFDAVVFYFWGWKPLFYFVFCIFLAGGLHPCAGHFISEHYVFPHLDATQETYSYYGKLNWLTWNVGYHNEHHDFANIPWSRLPALKKLAPEFYDNLAVCDRVATEMCAVELCDLSAEHEPNPGGEACSALNGWSGRVAGTVPAEDERPPQLLVARCQDEERDERRLDRRRAHGTLIIQRRGHRPDLAHPPAVDDVVGLVVGQEAGVEEDLGQVHERALLGALVRAELVGAVLSDALVEQRRRLRGPEREPPVYLGDEFLQAQVEEARVVQ